MFNVNFLEAIVICISGGVFLIIILAVILGLREIYWISRKWIEGYKQNR